MTKKKKPLKKVCLTDSLSMSRVFRVRQNVILTNCVSLKKFIRVFGLLIQRSLHSQLTYRNSRGNLS